MKSIHLSDKPAVQTRVLTDHVTAHTAADGSVSSIELTAANPFGDPGDEAAARRAIAWVHDRLSQDAAAASHRGVRTAPSSVRFNYSNFCSGIQLGDQPSVQTHVLTDNVIAFTAADGSLNSVELLDTRPFGDPFDEAAAQRAIAWVRARLEQDAAAS